MKRLIVVIILLFGILCISAQTIVIIGNQKIVSGTNNPELKCTPVKITKAMKITKIEGDCKGFWIQKGSLTTHKFKKMDDAIGTKLKPGIYYVYPYLNENAKKAKIEVTIESYNNS